MTIHEFHKGMRVFQINDPGDYLDQIYLALDRQIKVDVAKFDLWLHKQVGEYENEGMNMFEVIKANYGIAAAVFIQRLI